MVVAGQWPGCSTELKCTVSMIEILPLLKTVTGSSQLPAR